MSSREVRLDTSLESMVEHVGREGATGVLATLVSTAGSTYRKPGARMLIRADGSCFGLLSGGCLEADLGLHAAEVLKCGRPRAVDYDMRGPDDVLFGLGAGCEGSMRILLEPLAPGSPALAALTHAGDATRAGRSVCVVAVHAADDHAIGTRAPATLAPPALRAAAERALIDALSRQVEFEIEGRAARAFVQFLAPPPHLLLCGAGPDAVPVVLAARALGWRVTVVDHRPAYAVHQRFPGADVLLAQPGALRSRIAIDGCHAAVVMSHHLPSDIEYLRQLAAAGAPDYVGLLGPAARRQRIAHELGGDAELLSSRLRGPVGCDIGAVTPEGIALSIVSEVHAWLAGRTRYVPEPGS